LRFLIKKINYIYFQANVVDKSDWKEMMM
jgi:hypothetical protein